MKKDVQYNNSLLVCHVYGSGIAVVLLHGFGETNSVWKNQTEYLNSGSYLFLKNMLPGLFADQFKRRNRAVVNALIEEGRHFEKTGLQQHFYAMMGRPDSTGVLKNSRLPALFVIGTEDRMAPLNDLLKQVHLPEIAYIHIIADVAHMSMLKAPEKLNNILKSFINAFD